MDTIASVAGGGGQAFTWLMVFALVFFVPQALLFAELGTASCIGAVVIFFNRGNNLSTPLTYVVALLFGWITIVSAIASFRVGKWLPSTSEPCSA